MPPRKRARLTEATTPAIESPRGASDDEILSDPWTDDEEIGLFKGLIKWKPTGIHKHFKMLQLSNYLLENSYIHPKSEHTAIPGIWRKLATLYDLDSLDQREDAQQLSDLSDDGASGHAGSGDEGDDEAYSLAANNIHNETFRLSATEYGDEMWQRRLANDKQNRDESPVEMPELNLAIAAPVPFTPSFSIEPEESTAPEPKKRGRPRKSTVAVERPVPPSKRRSRRGAESPEAESEASEGNEDDDGEEGEEEDEDGSEDVGEQSEDETTAKRKPGRPRGKAQGRGRPRGRRR